MARLECWVIENDLDQRRSIIAALRHALEPEIKKINLRQFDDIDEAITAGRARRRWMVGRRAFRLPDLVLADLFRRDRHDLTPEEIAEIIATARVEKLQVLRKQLGSSPILVVVSQYVDYFLRALADDPDKADQAVRRVRTALEESTAEISYIADKFSPAVMSDAFAVIKGALLVSLPGR